MPFTLQVFRTGAHLPLLSRTVLRGGRGDQGVVATSLLLSLPPGVIGNRR